MGLRVEELERLGALAPVKICGPKHKTPFCPSTSLSEFIELPSDLQFQSLGLIKIQLLKFISVPVARRPFSIAGLGLWGCSPGRVLALIRSPQNQISFQNPNGPQLLHSAAYFAAHYHDYAGHLPDTGFITALCISKADYPPANSLESHDGRKLESRNR
jgi:hypothetical protein